MRPIGGEIESNSIEENIYFTDSGRSSLRLFFKSGFSDKKVLLPNYFCEVIEDVLKSENINYEFYNITEDLRVDVNSIENKQFDILYLINYFGIIQNIESLNLSEKIIIEDNVFSFDFKNNGNYKQWYGFNSFRKISSLSDGSLIKTNLSIDATLIVNKEADFVKTKDEAKHLKYQFIFDKLGDEQTYLTKFKKAENLLDEQNSIYSISNKSLYKLTNINQQVEQEVLKKRYQILSKFFDSYSLKLEQKEYSFFILKLEKRDELRKLLINKNIFLPIHWPQSSQENNLYSKLISIPLFSNYSDKEFKYMIGSIKEFLND